MSDGRALQVSRQLKKLPLNKQETHKVALVIQYKGTGFLGWQRQASGRTVQAEIEDAIATVLGKRSALVGAGRTDTGVHAAAQVAHFFAPKVIPAERWAAILNNRQGDDIVVRAPAAVGKSRPAQFSAHWRRYRYTFYPRR